MEIDFDNIKKGSQESLEESKGDKEKEQLHDSKHKMTLQ